MAHNPDYQRSYFQANKEAILAKREARRATMTEDQRTEERAKAKDRAARKRAKLLEFMRVAEQLAHHLEFEVLLMRNDNG